MAEGRGTGFARNSASKTWVCVQFLCAIFFRIPAVFQKKFVEFVQFARFRVVMFLANCIFPVKHFKVFVRVLNLSGCGPIPDCMKYQ